MSAATASASHETATPAAALALLTQVSAAAALIVFVRDLWLLSPLDHALVSAGAVGVGTYLALLCGYFVVRRILDMPAADAADDSETASESAAATAESSPATA